MKLPRIVDVRAFCIEAEPGVGADYHDRASGHWLVDTLIATPMSGYPAYKASRTSFGIDVLKSLVVEIEIEGGIVGVAAGFGGEPACYLVEKHFKRFLIGSDARDVHRLWDQMYRASMYYGRKGLPIAALSAVDLALWDVIGRWRGEPVYKLVGGATRESLRCYATGPRPDIAKQLGFLGGKIPLPHGPADGPEGLAQNVEVFARHRDSVGAGFPLMIDCWMSLTVPYAIQLAHALEPLKPYWIEEALHPDDWDGFKQIRAAAPRTMWTTGEHEYTRYGFRTLIETRAIDILQPDMMWVGGLTEALRIAALAAAYDIPVVPHGSGAYSYHFVMTQPHIPFCEYIVSSAKADRIEPVFGGLFADEPLPRDGHVTLSDAPGWGLELDRSRIKLRRPYCD